MKCMELEEQEVADNKIQWEALGWEMVESQ
jgi:hypothetical protein